MDGSFIPPPFPFPEVWPRVFAEQQQRQSAQWLTPSTFLPTNGLAVARMNGQYRYRDASPAAVSYPVDVMETEEEEDGESEYAFVLSDEWRARFQSSGRQQMQQEQQSRRARGKKKRQQKKQQQKQVANAGALAGASASRSHHLQREIQAARTRELAQKWKRRSGGSRAPASAATRKQVEAMETSLNVLFDEFCDAFQPVVWPHDPLH